MRSQTRNRLCLTAGRPFAARWLAVALLAGAVVAGLGGCAASGAAAGVVIAPLSQTHYAPTQTVDVLNAAPGRHYEALARLVVSDPTGAATSSQLVAQLSDSARTLGANALVIEKVAQSGAAGMAFNPAGGQMQGSSAGGSISVTALAIRYLP